MEGLEGLLPLDVHGTAATGMKGNLIPIGCIVNAFHEINLSMNRPVRRVCQPQGRPGTAAEWRMADIEDEETIGIRLFRLNPYRKTTGGSIRDAFGSNRGVDFENGSRGRCICQILRVFKLACTANQCDRRQVDSHQLFSLFLRDVVNEATSYCQ